jgi:hypothetical protein
MRSIAIFGLSLVGTAFVLPSCDRGWPDVYWRRDHYKLIAIDTLSQMSLANDATSSSIVPATVFAIGANAQFIVLKQHPYANFKFDSSVTNYFIVTRTESGLPREIEQDVRGPFTKVEFERLAAIEPLPPFTTTFDDLN